MSTIPVLPYKLFFLYLEPVSALAGAYYAAFQPDTYLALLASSPNPAPKTTYVALLQLANLYLLFALNEHLVLSSTTSLRTWRRLLFGLLVADLGHLLSMAPLGLEVFWKVWEWNAMTFGSVGFVYLGASLRIAFLAGLGVRSEKPKKAKR